MSPQVPVNLAPFKCRLVRHQVRTLCDTLRAVDTYLQEIGQPYFLTGGALIGFVRYGHVLPWDDDIDLHCYGPLAIEPRLISRLGLECDLSPHSIRFRKRRCRMLVEVLPLTAEGTIVFRGKTYSAGQVQTRRQLFTGAEISVPESPHGMLDGAYGVEWRTHAKAPGWDHVNRKPIPNRKSPAVAIEALSPIVERFRKEMLP